MIRVVLVLVVASLGASCQSMRAEDQMCRQGCNAVDELERASYERLCHCPDYRP